MPNRKDISIAAIVRYENARDAQGDFDKIKTFYDLYSATITDCEAKALARAARTQEDLSAAKQRAPMWYTGGACFGTHNADNVDPIGVVAIDADDIRPDRQTEIKRRLTEIPCVFFCAQSISGKGLYALASVSVDVQKDPEKVVRFLGLIDAAVLPDRQNGEHIDTACKDIARRRFESFDPACYFAPEKFAHEYTGEYRSRCREAFQRTQLAALAQLFGGRGVSNRTRAGHPGRQDPNPGGPHTVCAHKPSAHARTAHAQRSECGNPRHAYESRIAHTAHNSHIDSCAHTRFYGLHYI